MDEMRWASMALAVSLASSADQRFVSKMRSSGTQWAYTDLSTLAAVRPDSVCRDPISTRSGASRSLIAVPSAKNSGLDRTSKAMLSNPFVLAARTRSMASAVLTGTVDFSTMILRCPGSELRAIMRAADSQ